MSLIMCFPGGGSWGKAEGPIVSSNAFWNKMSISVLGGGRVGTQREGKGSAPIVLKQNIANKLFFGGIE